MTKAANRASTTTRRTGASKPTLNGHGPEDVVRDRDRDDDNERDGRTERDEQDSRNERRTERGTEGLRREEGLTGDRDDRSPRDARDEQRHGDRREFGDSGEPSGVQRTVEQLTDRARAATTPSVDAFAGTPDMSKVVTAWFDMAGNMMKLQQQFVATVLKAGTTNDRPTTKV